MCKYHLKFLINNKYMYVYMHLCYIYYCSTCMYFHWYYLITCIKLLASSIPGKEPARSSSSSFAKPVIPPINDNNYTR